MQKIKFPTNAQRIQLRRESSIPRERLSIGIKIVRRVIATGIRVLDRRRFAIGKIVIVEEEDRAKVATIPSRDARRHVLETWNRGQALSVNGAANAYVCTTCTHTHTHTTEHVCVEYSGHDMPADAKRGTKSGYTCLRRFVGADDSQESRRRRHRHIWLSKSSRREFTRLAGN